MNIPLEEIDKYLLRIPHGGIIEKNDVIMNMDRIAIVCQENSSGPTLYTPPDDIDLEMERKEMQNQQLQLSDVKNKYTQVK